MMFLCLLDIRTNPISSRSFEDQFRSRPSCLPSPFSFRLLVISSESAALRHVAQSPAWNCKWDGMRCVYCIASLVIPWCVLWVSQRNKTFLQLPFFTFPRHLLSSCTPSPLPYTSVYSIKIFWTFHSPILINSASSTAIHLVPPDLRKPTLGSHVLVEFTHLV